MHMKYKTILHNVKLALWPFGVIRRLNKLDAEANKWHQYLLDYLNDPEHEYFLTFLKNSGFALFNEQRCFIVHTQLPAEVIATIQGTEFEALDSVAIVEHIMHERMEPVFNQLVQNNLLDVVTLRHNYTGNGIIRTVMSNVAELEYLAYAEEQPLRLLRRSAAIWKILLSALCLAVLALTIIKSIS